MKDYFDAEASYLFQYDSFHLISHIKLYSNIIHQNKSIKHDMILRT